MKGIIKLLLTHNCDLSDKIVEYFYNKLEMHQILSIYLGQLIIHHQNHRH
jgi:hypothetical protein